MADSILNNDDARPEDDAAPGTSPDTGDNSEFDRLLKDCGGVDPQNPNKILIDQTLQALKMTQEGTERILGIPVKYSVDIGGNLHITSGVYGVTNNINLELLDARPKLARSRAEAEIASKEGITTTDFVAFSERSSLGDAEPAWNGVICAIQPGTHVTNSIGGKKIISQFSPPIPDSISPLATKEIYLKEIPGTLSWHHIEAKIMESTNTDANVGRIINGIAQVRAIEPNITIEQSDGTKFEIRSDIAIEFTTMFQDASTTVALGLRPSTKYYIDTNTKKFRAIIADYMDPRTPIAIFVNSDGSNVFTGSRP